MTKRSKFTHNPRNIPVYPFFKVLDPEDYVDIMIQVASKVLVFSDSYSPTVPILQVFNWIGGILVVHPKKGNKIVTDCHEETFSSKFVFNLSY